jgi:porphobilinogen deaminase
MARTGGLVRSLDDLPDGAVIGTSSVRRVAQLKRRYPGLVFKDVVRCPLPKRVNPLPLTKDQISCFALALKARESVRLLSRRTYVLPARALKKKLIVYYYVRSQTRFAKLDDPDGPYAP